MGWIDQLFGKPSSPVEEDKSRLEPNEKKYYAEIGDLLRGDRPFDKNREEDERILIRRAREYTKVSQQHREAHSAHIKNEGSEFSSTMVLVAELARDVVYDLRTDRTYSALLEDRERVRQAQIKVVDAIINGQSKDQNGDEEGKRYAQDEFKLAMRITDLRASRHARNDAREELGRIMKKMILEELRLKSDLTSQSLT